MTVKTKLDKDELEDRKITPRLAEDLIMLAEGPMSPKSNTSNSVLPDNLKPSN